MLKLTLPVAVAVAIGMTHGAHAANRDLDLSYKAPADFRIQIAAAKHDLLTKKKKTKDDTTEVADTATTDTAATNGTVDHSMHTMDPNMDHSKMDHATHHHGAGMWMLEYRFMRMTMNGMLDGAKEVDPKDLLPTYDEMGNLVTGGQYDDFVREDGSREWMVSEDMTMDMHMFMVMYSFTDRFTGMVMFNYLSNEMTMTMAMPMEDMDMPGMYMTMQEPMSMESSGLGDTQIGFTYQLENWRQFSPLFTFLMNVPTGSIDEKDEMGEMLPYSMQLGSGSYDFTVGLNLKSKVEQWTTGLEAQYTWRMTNEQNYSLGNAYKLRAWASFDLKAGQFMLNFRGGIDHTQTSEIDGRDDRIMENTDYYGAMRTDLRVGAGVGLPKGHMVEFQYAMPLHQDVNGYQMKIENIWELAWQWMF